jgi:hypothetical protein
LVTSSDADRATRQKRNPKGVPMSDPLDELNLPSLKEAGRLSEAAIQREAPKRRL